MTKKKSETKELINTNKDLINIEVQDTIEAILTARKPSKKNEKWLKFHLLRMFGIDTQLSAKIAGYNSQYGYKLIEKYRNTPKIRHTLEAFVNSMPDDYRLMCKLRLPQVAEIERKALAEYQDKPKLAIDKPALLKQVKQGAGVLVDDDRPAIQFINVERLQQHMLQVHREKCKLHGITTPLKRIDDAEVLDYGAEIVTTNGVATNKGKE